MSNKAKPKSERMKKLIDWLSSGASTFTLDSKAKVRRIQVMRPALMFGDGDFLLVGPTAIRIVWQPKLKYAGFVLQVMGFGFGADCQKKESKVPSIKAQPTNNQRKKRKQARQGKR
jgi:hypothetical protein